jgi:hypothetical protein
VLTARSPYTHPRRCSPDADVDPIQGWLLPELDTVGSIYSVSNGTCWTVLGWGGTCDGGCVALGDCEGVRTCATPRSLNTHFLNTSPPQPYSTQFYRGSAAENATSSFFTIAQGPSWLNQPAYENVTFCVQENHAGRYLQAWPCSGDGSSPGEGWESIAAPSATSAQLENDWELHFDPRRRCVSADFPCPASATPSLTPSPGASVSGTPSLTPTRTVTRTKTASRTRTVSPPPAAVPAKPADREINWAAVWGGLGGSLLLLAVVAGGALWVLKFGGGALLQGVFLQVAGGGGSPPGAPKMVFLSAAAGGVGSSGAQAAVARLNFAANAAPAGSEKVSLLRALGPAPTYGAHSAI